MASESDVRATPASGGGEAALLALNACLCAIIFAIDLTLPLGVAGGVPYVVVVLLALRLREPGATLAFAGLCSALTLLGLVMSPPGAELAVGLTNRFLALLAIWVTVVLGLRERRAQAGQQASEGQFRSLADTAPVMIWHANPQRRFDFFSKGWLDFTGRALPDELGEGWMAGLHPQDGPRFRRILETAFNAHSEFASEHRLRCAQGDYRWVLLHGAPRFDAQGRFIGFIGTCVDVTERHLYEQRLRASESRQRAIMENMLAAIVTSDDAGTVESFNRAAERMFGYRAHEVLGRDIAVLMDEQDTADHQDEGVVQTRGGKMLTLGAAHERLGRRKDGTHFPMELATTVYHNDGRRYFIDVMQDISERKRAERELAETRQQYHYQEKMAAMGTLAAGIVHEIANPVAGIAGLVEDILSEHRARGHLEPATREHLALILEQTRRLTAIARDVSVFSTSPSGERELLDLNEVIERTCRLMRHDERLRDIELRLDLDRQLPAVSALNDQLVQVLLNLISNAADACESCPDRCSIRVSTRREGAAVKMVVEDTGTGMPAEVLARAGEALFTTKAPGRGSGLGLSMCRSVVDLHGGTLAIDSSPGEGTRVTIALPVEV